MKTQYYTAASLDGFIATEDDSLDWLFALGDLEESRPCSRGASPIRRFAWSRRDTRAKGLPSCAMK